MLEDFNFDVLENPDFKEDSVREEIIVPLLQELGYYASGSAKIIRSKSLTHPFVHIGTKPHKITIIPDYLLVIDEKHKWILDAKSPNEKILSGKNVEQAYSYAIHPEVRANKYALCNGRELIVFDISRFEPLLQLKTNEMNEKFDEVLRVLSPLAFTKPHVLNFKPDFGLTMRKLGASVGMINHFLEIGLPFIAKLEDGLYSASVGMEFGNGEVLMTFDFSEIQLKELLKSVRPLQSLLIKDALRRQPFQIRFEENIPVVRVVAKIQDVVISNENEDYSPLLVEEFGKAVV
jgi:hypothetical protein